MDEKNFRSKSKNKNSSGEYHQSKKSQKEFCKSKPCKIHIKRCRICGKFLNISNYNVHMRRHLDERDPEMPMLQPEVPIPTKNYDCKSDVELEFPGPSKQFQLQKSLTQRKHGKVWKRTNNTNTCENFQSQDTIQKNFRQNSEDPEPGPSRDSLMEENQTDDTTEDDEDDEDYVPGSKLRICHSTKKKGCYTIPGKTRNKYQHRRLPEKLKMNLLCEICGTGFYSSQTLEFHQSTCQEIDIKRDNPRKPDVDFPAGADPIKTDIDQTSTLPVDSTINKSVTAHAHANKNKIQPADSLCCPYCWKRMSHRSTLINHIRLHTGEKPFKCDHCLARFANPIYLGQHRKNCGPVNQVRGKLKAERAAEVPTAKRFIKNDVQPKAPVSTSQTLAIPNSNVVTVVITATSTASADMGTTSSTSATATATAHAPQTSSTFGTSPQEMYECDFCNSFFYFPSELLRHILRECNTAPGNAN